MVLMLCFLFFVSTGAKSNVQDVGPGHSRSFDNDGDELGVSSDQSGFIFGKDRVLVQFNVDLKKVFTSLFDSDKWNRFWGSAIRLIRFHIDSKFQFRKNAVEIVSDIRERNVGSKLKCFVGTIDEAYLFAKSNQRLIVVYIEGGDTRFPSSSSAICRSALSDPLVGNILNDEYVFYASTIQHAATRNITESLFGRFDRNDFPKFAILKVGGEPNKDSCPPPEVVIHWMPTKSDVTSSSLIRFLQRFVCSNR